MLSVLEAPQWILSEVSLNVQKKNTYLQGHHGEGMLKAFWILLQGPLYTAQSPSQLKS